MQEVQARLDALRARDDAADAPALAAAEVELAGLALQKAMADEAALDPITTDDEKLAYAMQREHKQEVLQQKLAAAQAFVGSP